MTSFKLCVTCGVHEVRGQNDECRFCLLEEEDYIDSEVDVEIQMRRPIGRRIAEGFRIIDSSHG